jgi:hypothetical protein
MDINLFGFKLNLEILILIGVVYLIMVGHTLCGCSNMPLIMEGLRNINNSDDSSTDSSTDTTNTNDINKKKVAVLKKEGFTGANTNNGNSSPYSVGDYSSVDTSSWGLPTLTITPGKKTPKAVTDFLNRESQPIPLPEGEMLMFANTKFAPEFCPNTYSNSSGCAAMTSQQYNYLITRGGNNVPYSEY